MLIFHDFARFRFAKETLQFRDDVIRYGATTGPLERDPWAAFRFVCVGGKTPYDDDVFSSLKDTPLFPHMMKKRLPVWADVDERGTLDEQGAHYAGAIRSALDYPPLGWLVVDRTYRTQSVDTAVLEPDNANCWYDAATQSLHMVVPTPGPLEVTQGVVEMASKSRVAVKQFFLHLCYTVGYGSKDHYSFPLLFALWHDRGVLRRRPSGAPRERPLRAVPDFAQASRLRHALSHGRRQADRPDPGVQGRFRSQRRRPL